MRKSLDHLFFKSQSACTANPTTWRPVWDDGPDALQWSTQPLFVFSKHAEEVLAAFQKVLDAERRDVGLRLLHFDPGVILLVAPLQVVGGERDTPGVFGGLPANHHGGGQDLLINNGPFGGSRHLCRVSVTTAC